MPTIAAAARRRRTGIKLAQTEQRLEAARAQTLKLMRRKWTPQVDRHMSYAAETERRLEATHAQLLTVFQELS